MKYCELLLNELNLDSTDVMPCCTPISTEAPKYLSTKNGTINPNDIDLKRRKLEICEELNEKSNNFLCKQCIHLIDCENFQKEDLYTQKYNSIHIKSTSRDEGIESYSKKEILQKAYAEDMIDTENLTVRFREENDVSISEEVTELLSLFEEKGFNIIHFSTINTTYQPTIEKLLKEGKCTLNVSLDCGNSETYKKIKQIDKFNDCIENLKKYVEVAKQTEAITIHYMLIKGLNDNKEEIINFFKLMNEIGIKTVGVRINHKDLTASYQKKLSSKTINNYKKLITFFCDEAKKYNMRLDNDSCREQNFLLNKKEGFFENIKNFFK